MAGQEARSRLREQVAACVIQAAWRSRTARRNARAHRRQVQSFVRCRQQQEAKGFNEQVMAWLEAASLEPWQRLAVQQQESKKQDETRLLVQVSQACMARQACNMHAKRR